MTRSFTNSTNQAHRPLAGLRRLAAAYGSAAIVLVLGVLTFDGVVRARESRELVAYTRTVIDTARVTLSDLQDVQTAERGYVITGEERYLEPYARGLAALAMDTAALRRLTRDNPRQQRRLDTLATLVGAKLRYLEETIALRRTQGFSAAAGIVRTDRGQQVMDEIRRVLRDMRVEEYAHLAARIATEERRDQVVTIILVAGTLAAVVFSLLLNGLLTRYAAAQVAAADELEAQNTQLQEQGLELELQAQHLQDQATELEMANEELQTASDALHERTEVAEAARVAAERAEERLRFLAAASETLAASLDYEATLTQVARLAVPTLADWSAVDLRGADGQFRRLAVCHPDPAKVALAKTLGERYPESPDIPHWRHNVLRTGRSELMPDIPDDLFAASAHDPEHLRIIRELGLRSYMAVPLTTSDGEVLGVVSFVAAESGRRYTEADVALAEDLARRAATAIENARLLRDLNESREQLEQQAGELEAQTEELQTSTEELMQQTELAEQARADAELARGAAEAANRAKAEFLTTMSHELRTPLNAIGGYVDLIMMGIRGPVPAEQLNDLRRVKRSGQHLLSLINDILNFAKLEAGQIEFHLADVRLGDVLESVEALIAPQMQAKGLVYSYSHCDGAITVITDSEKLQQVLLNLLTNACKFTDAGGTVAVECTADDALVTIRVRDTGRGIPVDKLVTIFEPFVQVDRHLTRESQQGVGLGLAISRDLVRGMGGELTVESAVDQGATFTLTLPRGTSGVAAPARSEGDLPPTRV